MNQLNEVRRFQKIAGLLKENETDQIVNKAEDSVEAKLDQLSPQQIQQLQADLAKMGITADTSVEDAAKKIEGNLNEAEGDDKKKLADTLSAIGTGLIGSLLVPIIPAAIGHSTGIGMAGGLGLTLAAGGLLVGLAKALGQKQGSSERGNNESLYPGDTVTMGNINEAGAKWQSKLNPEVNGIEIYNDGDNRLFVIFDKNTGGIHVINDFNGEDFDEVWGTDGDVRPELLATIKKSGKMEDWHPDDPASVDMDDIEDQDPEDFDDLSEDDYSEDPSSDMDDESQSGDTSVMNINETDEIKKRQLYARYVNGFINQNQDALGQIYDEQGYLAALKMIRDKVAAILHRAGEYEYPTAESGIGDSFPLVDAIHRIFKQIGFKKAHKGV